MKRLPKLIKLEIRPNVTLKITFQVGKNVTIRTIRLSGFVARYKGLAALNDPAIFKKAKVIDWGAAIGWPGNLDVGTSTLWRLAQEQTPF